MYKPNCIQHKGRGIVWCFLSFFIYFLTPKRLDPTVNKSHIHSLATNKKASLNTEIWLQFIDIDECAHRVCQYKCNNTAGSFFCSCPQGYLLTTNKRDCAGKLECEQDKHTVRCSYPEWGMQNGKWLGFIIFCRLKKNSNLGHWD